MTNLDPKTQLSIAELVIYLILVPIILYILIRHGKLGYLGWSFLIVFCGLRLASDGIQIGNHDNAAKGGSAGSSGAIINSIGLSGLLYSLSGIIHEWSMLLHCYQTFFPLTVSPQLPPHPQPQPQHLCHHPAPNPPHNQRWHCPRRHRRSQPRQTRITHKQPLDGQGAAQNRLTHALP
jgi:hypothetical protein